MRFSQKYSIKKVKNYVVLLEELYQISQLPQIWTWKVMKGHERSFPDTRLEDNHS